jgi:hypothetical protein
VSRIPLLLKVHIASKVDDGLAVVCAAPTNLLMYDPRACGFESIRIRLILLQNHAKPDPTLVLSCL